jgi:hypothetical protein
VPHWVQKASSPEPGTGVARLAWTEVSAVPSWLVEARAGPTARLPAIVAVPLPTPGRSDPEGPRSSFTVVASSAVEGV